MTFNVPRREVQEGAGFKLTCNHCSETIGTIVAENADMMDQARDYLNGMNVSIACRSCSDNLFQKE